mgnify:CR=1 FL=1
MSAPAKGISTIIKKLGLSNTKKTVPNLNAAIVKAKEINKKPQIQVSTIEKIKNKLKNDAMSVKQRDVLRAKVKKLEADKKKQDAAKNVIATLQKEKKKQINLNVNQKSGENVQKVIKGPAKDEMSDAAQKVLRTPGLDKKELKDKGMVSGASDFRLNMAALKGQTKGLVEALKKKKKLYDDLSLEDKRGEKGQLLQNAMKGISDKLKGKVPIKTLRGAGLLPSGLAQGGMGLKMPTANQTGLKKLPTPVRNKMGYMYGGGMGKKPRMSKMDYRKGGMVIIALDLKKKGKK